MQKSLSLAVIALLSTANAVQVRSKFSNWGAPSKPVCKPSYQPEPEPACGCCPCIHEFDELDVKLTNIESELGLIKNEQASQSGKLDTVASNSDSLGLEITSVQGVLSEILAGINSSVGAGEGAAGGNTVVNVNVQGCCSCTCDTPVPEPPVGETPEPEPVNECLTPENQLVDQEEYIFKQGYPTGTCDNEFLLWSPFINIGDAKLNGSYHGKLVDESDRTTFG